MPSDDRIELAFFRQLRQVTTERAQRRRLHILLAGGRLATAVLLGFRRREIWIELLQDFVASPLDIHLEALEDARGDAFAFA